MSIKYKMKLSIGLLGASQEEVIKVSDYGFSDEDWENLSEETRKKELEEMLQEFCNDLIDTAIYEVK